MESETESGGGNWRWNFGWALGCHEWWWEWGLGRDTWRAGLVREVKCVGVWLRDRLVRVVKWAGVWGLVNTNVD